VDKRCKIAAREQGRGVVKKKLKLKLDSEKIGKERLYRIVKSGAAS